MRLLEIASSDKEHILIKILLIGEAEVTNAATLIPHKNVISLENCMPTKTTVRQKEKA